MNFGSTLLYSILFYSILFYSILFYYIILYCRLDLVSIPDTRKEYHKYARVGVKLP